MKLCFQLTAIIFIIILSASCDSDQGINRHDLVSRNNVENKEIDSLNSLSVGNGEFAFTVDVTGLQTFPEFYSGGIFLGTMSNWGWDFPMLAMSAAAIGRGEQAVEFLMMETPKNRYFLNGHNYQNPRLAIFLPGNGGLLTAVARMCVYGQFPHNGRWNVRWENLNEYVEGISKNSLLIYMPDC